MKSYIKLVTILLFIATILSAQQSAPFDNQMPETWKPDFSNSYVRKSTNPRQPLFQYTPAEFSKGRQYNMINTKTKVNTTTSIILQNNGNNDYYRSYSIKNTTIQNAIYNAPVKIEQVAINATIHPPFDDVVTTGNTMYALNRGDKPNDPSISKSPIGDAILPLLLIAGVYITIKLNKIKS